MPGFLDNTKLNKNLFPPIPLSVQQEAIQNAFLSCDHLHPGYSCESFQVLRLPELMKSNAKIYLLVHLIPFILYKRKVLMKRPIHTICKSLYGYGKSILFLTLMVFTFRYSWCRLKMILKKNHCNSHNIKVKIQIDIVPSVGGIVGGFSLLFESHNRAQEICLFIVPRFFETLFNFLKKRGLVQDLPQGELILFSIILGVLHYYYQNDKLIQPKTFKESYYKALNWFWGIN